MLSFCNSEKLAAEEAAAKKAAEENTARELGHFLSCVYSLFSIQTFLINCE